MPARARVSLGILAGGRGSRLGGVDKAFVEVGGVALLERVLAAAGAGFAEVRVSLNKGQEPRRQRFEGRGIRFVADAVDAGQGPLAGLDAMLRVTVGEWLLSLPVDLAQPSSGLVEHLLQTEGAIVRDADGLQPLVGLWPVAAARPLVRAALEGPDRSAHAVATQLGLRVMDVAPLRLGNLNTPDDLRSLR